MSDDNNYKHDVRGFRWQDTKIEIGRINRQPPDIGIFDPPTRCFIINQEWWTIVSGMVDWLADVAAWPAAQDEEYAAIKEIQRFMQGVECMDFALRQSPADNCILQQTLDGGTTWTDVFDFSLCATIQDQSNSVNIQNAITYVQPTFQDTYNDYITNYVAAPSDVHPDLAYSAENRTELNAAYCNAVWTLVNILADNSIEYYRDFNELQNEINIGIAIATVVLSVIALAGAVPTAGASLAALAPLAALWGVSIGVAATLGNALVDSYQAHTIDQFQDTNAREEVACYIVENLSGEDNTHATMIATIQGHTLTDNAAAIADVLAIVIEAPATYAAFLEKWQNNLEYAEAGIELFCPCEIGTSSPEIGLGNCSTLVPLLGILTWQHDDIWHLSSETNGAEERAQLQREGIGKFRILTATLVSGVRMPPFHSWQIDGGVCTATVDDQPNPAFQDMLHYGFYDNTGVPFVVEIRFVDVD